jgi:hypothetical protein
MVKVGIDLESGFPAMARTLVGLKHRSTFDKAASVGGLFHIRPSLRCRLLAVRPEGANHQ